MPAPLAPNGRESPVQEQRGPGAQQLPGNNEAVALATESGLSLGLKAESGNRCLKNRRWEQRGLDCFQSCLSLREDAGLLSREDDQCRSGSLSRTVVGGIAVESLMKERDRTQSSYLTRLVSDYYPLLPALTGSEIWSGAVDGEVGTQG